MFRSEQSINLKLKSILCGMFPQDGFFMYENKLYYIDFLLVSGDS